MADIFKPKRGSHNVIARINPLLEDGEVVFEYPETNNRGLGLIKMGDGVHRYNELPTFLVTITDYIPIAEKGAANGIAPLNPAGKIDADFLPSYVDDVLEYPSREEFPVPGEKGKIYVDTSAVWNNIYRWSGTIYVCIGTSVRYELKQNKNVIRLQGTDDSVNTVDVTQIYEYEGLTNFPYPGKTGCIYVDVTAVYNNLYRWDDTNNRYVGCANANSYSLEKAGPNIILHSSDGTDSYITSEILEYNSPAHFPIEGIQNVLYIDISTTENNIYRWDGTEYKHVTTSVKYTIAKNENNLILTGSDGSEISIENDVMFFASKEDFPTPDPEADPPVVVSAYKLFVDESTNSIYRWNDSEQDYIAVSGDTTYTLSRNNNTIYLTTRVSGVDSTTSIPTSVAKYNGTSSFPTTGEIGIIYIDDNTDRTNNLYKWDTTSKTYKIIGGDTTYDLTKGNVNLKLISSTGQQIVVGRDVITYNNTSAFPTTGELSTIYVDASVDSNNLYRWTSSGYKRVAVSSSITSVTKDTTNHKINIVQTDGNGNDTTTSVLTSVAKYASKSNFPSVGSLDVLYVVSDDTTEYNYNNLFRWTGTTYVKVAGTNFYSLSRNTTDHRVILSATTPSGTSSEVSRLASEVQVYDNTSFLNTTGSKDIIYVDKSKNTNNLYISTGVSKKFSLVGGDTTYSISIANATDGREVLSLSETKYSNGNWTTTVTNKDIKDTIKYYRGKDLFPTTGHLDMIYVDIQNDKTYVWNALETKYEEVLSGTDFVKATISKSGDTITITNQYTGTTKTSTIKTDVIQANGISNFPNPGTTNTLYIDTSKTTKNLYRWNTTQYVQVASNTTYELSKSGNTIILTGSDGATTSATVVTYTLTSNGTTIKLVGSDGSSTNVTDQDHNTTYSISKSGGGIVLTGSDGSTSAVTNIGGVDIRNTDPTGADLYVGKMWIKV